MGTGQLFVKMHGLGNDFILLNGISNSSPPLSVSNLRFLADRRLGIGFDQLLLLTPPIDDSSDFFCRIFNTDGSEVGQCGNGIRCAHIFILEQNLAMKEQLVFATCTTRIKTHVVGKNHVRAVMLPAQHFCPQYAMAHHFQHLDVGNPHYVCFEGAAVSDEELITMGKVLNDTVFGGVNVGAATIIAEGIQLRVYERGVGLTAACGSGALAAAVSAIQMEKTTNPVEVFMPGGTLLCGVNEDGSIWLEGSVTRVFEGTLPPLEEESDE